MKVFKEYEEVTENLTEKVKFYSRHLQSKELLILKSNNSLDHIAAYLAWQDNLGKILVVAPMMPEIDQENLIKSMESFEHVDDGVFFHTSGTTGFPKLIQHGRTQFSMFEKMGGNAFDFTSQTKFLSILPPFTSGFWFIVIPSFCKLRFNLYISSRETIVRDLQNANCNNTIIVPNVINFIKSSNIIINFSNFETIGMGGAPILEKHPQYFFDNGAKKCVVAYGTTENGTPLLARKIFKEDSFYNYFDLNPTHSDIELKLVEKELWVKSPSNCNNFKSFKHVDEWKCTGDLWEEENGLIKFLGRNDDLIKMNGFFTNLFGIESWIENNTNFGECLATVKSIGGNDYIELFHTNYVDKSDKNKLSEEMLKFFPRCELPKRFKFVNELPKNAMGKKQRHLLK